jgi:hypothetical protein
VARERWQCRCSSIQVPANWTTYPTSRRRDRGTYWYREYRTRQQERQASCCSLWGAALLRLQVNFPQNLLFRAARGCLRLPYPPTRTKQKSAATAYRTLPQEHTVPSYKCLLPPASPMPRRKLPTKNLQIMRFLRCLVSRKNIPYSTTSFTVPRYKEYRTHQQGIPYSPARNTVLTSKEYRTLPQNLTYPATKAARNVPAKHRKYVGERSERPVYVYC